MTEQILFLLLAIGAIGATTMVIVPPTGRNPLYAALMLVVSFVFVAGLYVLLLAHTMAVIQVLVYAGAIMVLFMFVIMLLNLRDEELGAEKLTVAKMIGGVVTLFILIKAAIAVGGAASKEAFKPALFTDLQSWSLAASGDGEGQFGNIESIGDALFRQFLLPFELTSILLLVAVIGAVVLAKRTLK